ncbi:hypothetical protein GCM10009634_01040 [Saccharothrix xinjiangensis]
MVLDVRLAMPEWRTRDARPEDTRESRRVLRSGVACPPLGHREFCVRDRVGGQTGRTEPEKVLVM